MKLLRVMTGFHAGAQISVVPGTYRISASADADVQITDWQHADVLLEVAPDGAVSATLSLAATDEATVAADGGTPAQPSPETVEFVDLVPVRFGQVVLCVGKDDLKWPSDMELLSTLLARPQAARPRGVHVSRPVLAIAIASVLVGAVALIGLFLDTSEASYASAPRLAVEQAQRIQNALALAHLDGLHAQAAGKTIVISGMVQSDADDLAVRRVLGQFEGHSLIERNYDVVQQVKRSIGDMLGVSGAYVTYLGDARFAVTGPTIHKAALEAAVAKARSDLSSNIADIELKTFGPGAPPKPGPAYSEMISSGNVRFAQTPDGVKHLFSNDPMEGYEGDLILPSTTSNR